MTALQPDSGRASQDGEEHEDRVYDDVHHWGVVPRHNWGIDQHTRNPAASEYRELGQQDHPQVYATPEVQVTKDPPMAHKIPMIPKVPVVIECDDSEPPVQHPQTPPTSGATGRLVGAGLRVNAGAHNQGMGALGVSPAPIPGGAKTPSGVPQEFQELNFQQIQILIEKLEALKTGGQGSTQPSPPSDPDSEDDHLYDHIPGEEEERCLTSSLGIGKPVYKEAPKPFLPPKPPKPNKRSPMVKQTAKSKPGAKGDNKPRKGLGK